MGRKWAVQGGAGVTGHEAALTGLEPGLTALIALLSLNTVHGDPPDKPPPLPALRVDSYPSDLEEQERVRELNAADGECLKGRSCAG